MENMTHDSRPWLQIREMCFVVIQRKTFSFKHLIPAKQVESPEYRGLILLNS
jgi:hypothetical protein